MAKTPKKETPPDTLHLIERLCDAIDNLVDAHERFGDTRSWAAADVAKEIVKTVRKSIKQRRKS